MTKAEELAILDGTIRALGEWSYLGPWLESVRAEVARDVTSDRIPLALPSETQLAARAILAEAEARGVQLLDYAQADAARTRAVAVEDARRAREDAVAALRGALRSLGVR
jgi:multidrug efflux pump subunit AcrA (membrane-fusion protein)